MSPSLPPLQPHASAGRSSEIGTMGFVRLVAFTDAHALDIVATGHRSRGDVSFVSVDLAIPVCSVFALLKSECAFYCLLLICHFVLSSLLFCFCVSFDVFILTPN